MRKPLLLVFALCLTTAIGAGSFFAVRALVPDGASETGAEPPTPDFDLLDRLIEEDGAKPRFNGVINGIRIYDPDKGPERDSPCIGAEPHWASPELTKTSPLDINPSYLPPGTVEQEAKAVECGGVLASVERLYGGPGGIFTIARFQGEPAMSISAPAERLKAISIAGKRAVLVEPVIPLHPTVVVVAEQFGVTTAGGDRPDELIKILESLQ